MAAASVVSYNVRNIEQVVLIDLQSYGVLNPYQCSIIVFNLSAGKILNRVSITCHHRQKF